MEQDVSLTLVSAILTAAVPTLLIVVSILLNRSDYHRLHGEIGSVRSELRAEFRTDLNAVRSDLDRVRSELTGEINVSRNQQHLDMLRLFELYGEHSQRIAKIETKMER
jgi:hypothetical protein